MKSEKYTNSLIKEKSPYLLQHAHNPVNWYAWNDEALAKAKQEDKLMLVSVGYSACHWCHVMEHESFEDEEVAAIMNEHFVCIKVDREERPDIDQVYMTAVQIMTGHGGWPLNCFALPDGRPVYGGTYFPKEHWKNILLNLAAVYKNDRPKAEQYADELTKGMLHIERLEALGNGGDNELSMTLLQQSVKKWKQAFDTEKGGANRAPKFPMPNNWLFLLRYAYFSGDKQAHKQVHLTLQCMANGGIYDHVGGGFARYSTDTDWKVPHFEKMLYDNAQLVSLYAEAYQESRIELYKDVVYETLAFVEREMTSPEDGFYSALDADSEGEEGKFYVWQEEELRAAIPGDDYPLFSEAFSVNEKGYWEHDNYILLKSVADAGLALKYGLSEEALKQKITGWKKLLLEARSRRVRPGLDDKLLAGWNAMMIKGCCDAGVVFGEEKFLQRAKASAGFLLGKFRKKDGGLYHAYKNGEAYINGFLEDYAFAAEALLTLFQATGEEKWFDAAAELINYAIAKFSDPHSGMFYFTSSDDEALVIRRAEIADNVIPASNSQMARNLYALYRMTGQAHYRMAAEKMLNNVKQEIGPYASGYSNWSLLLLEMLQPAHEAVIVGKNVDEKISGLRQHYLPGTIFAYSKTASSHPLFKNRFQENKTLIYICRNNTCSLPAETVEEALRQLS